MGRRINQLKELTSSDFNKQKEVPILRANQRGQILIEAVFIAIIAITFVSLSMKFSDVTLKEFRKYQFKKNAYIKKNKKRL